MPTFVYRVRKWDGQAVSGQIDAGNIREAAAKLRTDGFFITDLRPAGALAEQQSGLLGKKSTVSDVADKQSKKHKVKLKDLLVFTTQFAVMIRAGLNLVNCLGMLALQTESKNLRDVITQIRYAVEGGETLSVALAKFPKVFPPIYIHMVEAGEASGQLDSVLERLSEHLNREFELRKKVTGALTYPMVIVFVAVMVVFFLMTFVVPTFVTMFQDGGMELPGITKFVIAVSDLCVKYWYLVLAGIFGTFIGGKLYYDSPNGRKTVDRLLYRTKIFGTVIQKLASARFSRTLATLLDSGVMIVPSLELVEKAVGNTVIAAAIQQARSSITKGSGIAKPLEETKVFPPMVVQMTAVGEETGALSTLLNQVADFYEKEAGYAVESLTTLIEPAIIMILGLVVGTIVAAIALPMFDMGALAVK